MEFHDTLMKLTDRRIDLANKYAKERSAYGKVKRQIDIIYAANMAYINEIKKNAGYETGLLILMDKEGDYLQTMYGEMIEHLNNFKAMERMIDAIESKTMALQSIMRYYRENDTY